MGRETVLFDVNLHCTSCEDQVKEHLYGRDGILDVRAD